MVKIKYGGTPELGKKLFGYGPWKEKKQGRIYTHKPIVGRLQGLAVRRTGRAALMTPLGLVPIIKSTIKELGGEVRDVKPILLRRTEVEGMYDKYYENYLRILIGILEITYRADTDREFRLALSDASDLTRKFEAFVSEASNYAEGETEPKTLYHVFDGLKSISDQNLKAAKLQVGIMLQDLKKEYQTLVKSK